MNSEKEFLRLKHQTETAWSDYLMLAMKDMNGLSSDVDALLSMCDALKMKRAAAFVSICMAKTFLEVCTLQREAEERKGDDMNCNVHYTFDKSIPKDKADKFLHDVDDEVLRKGLHPYYLRKAKSNEELLKCWALFSLVMAAGCVAIGIIIGGHSLIKWIVGLL